MTITLKETSVNLSNYWNNLASWKQNLLVGLSWIIGMCAFIFCAFGAVAITSGIETGFQAASFANILKASIMGIIAFALFLRFLKAICNA